MLTFISNYEEIAVSPLCLSRLSLLLRSLFSSNLLSDCFAYESRQSIEPYVLYCQIWKYAGISFTSEKCTRLVFKNVLTQTLILTRKRMMSFKYTRSCVQSVPSPQLSPVKLGAQMQIPVLSSHIPPLQHRRHVFEHDGPHIPEGQTISPEHLYLLNNVFKIQY